MSTVVIDPLADPRWPFFVGNHPEANVFHQPGWTSALVETFGYEPRVYGLEVDGGIVAAWPAILVKSRLTGNRLVCLPLCHRAGPLIDSEEQGEQLLRSVVSEGGTMGVRSIEVRDWPRAIAPPQGLQRASLHVTHKLDISRGPESVTEGLSQNMRRSIRKAVKNGVTVRVGESYSDLRLFYRLYLDQRRQQGLLPQPEAFIQKVYEKFIVPGNGFMVLAEHDGSPVSGLLVVAHRATMTWTHSGALPLARDILATPLALWRSVEEGCSRGYATFDFGRTDAGDTGLLRFKEQWGASREDLSYYYHGRASGVNVAQPSHLKRLLLESYLRIVPERIVVRMSGRIYKHLG